MEIFYPIFISFCLVFFSELGDKTQLLVLSFSTKLKTINILLGVALGSIVSFGTAIFFGSFLGNIENNYFHNLLEIITFSSFIIFGIITLIPSKTQKNINKSNLLNKFGKYNFHLILIIAISIIIGELGDKTFLSSIGLGINYPYSKLLLIIGSVLGMILSDFFAIILGKFLSKKIPENIIEKFSGILFIIFGLLGFINSSIL